MDYKEKYEKALEWMKSIYPTMQGSDKEDAEHYFPELKESEDDKIRDDIMVAVENWHTYERVEEIRYYLRKQKEQRDYRKLYEGVTKSDWFKKNYEGKSLGEEQKPVENSGKELLYVSNKSYNIGYRDGKREAEQNPSEWSEADEVYLQDALWCVEKAEKSCKDDEDKGACWSAKRWLKSLRPSWKPSDEQMEALRRASTNEYVSAEQFDILVSLYAQLKKL